MPQLPRILWVVAVATFAFSAGRFRAATERLTRAVVVDLNPSVPDPDRISADTLTHAASVILGTNPFRPTRAVAAAESLTVASTAPTATVPVLRGILGGPPWSVVVGGLPGVPDAVVLRIGDTVAGYFVARVSSDTVVLTNGAANYTLTFTVR